MSTPYFTYSSVDRNLDYFEIFIAINAALNIHVQVFVGTHSDAIGYN
jgi:hypothetical protein